MVTETKEGESLNTKTYTKLFRDVESFEDLEEYTEFFSVEGSYWQLLKKPFLQNTLRSQCTRLENALPQQMLGLHTGSCTKRNTPWL